MQSGKNQIHIEEKILIIDFGSQVTQLIARRLREIGIYAYIKPYHILKKPEKNINGIILSGGPCSVVDTRAPQIPKWVLHAQIPILAICYGQQAIAKQMGGDVKKIQGAREFGRAMITIRKKSPLFGQNWKVKKQYQVWMSHGDEIIKLPKGFHVIGDSERAPFAAIENTQKNIYAVQFHPEVVHTPDGAKLLQNFAREICHCTKKWSMHAFLKYTIEEIQNNVKGEKVICALSGGVDSAVTAALIYKAIGTQLTCVFVDTGLMRENEAENVIKLFRHHYKIPLIHLQARDEFLNALKNIADPEKKRKIIGAKFIELFEKQARKIKNVTFLAQGTLYPDIIESVSFTGSPSQTIKSHHNVGGLPERMNLKLLEPLRLLFKDEVREVGRELKLPNDFIKRHPFPGPGLAIRIPGKITRQKVTILQRADAIFIEEIRKKGHYNKIWQAFAVLLPVKTVGVMGDGRSYQYVCVLRAVTATDGMTAEAYPFTHRFIAQVATRIINEVNGINRVCYDVTSKPPATIEWE